MQKKVCIIYNYCVTILHYIKFTSFIVSKKSCHTVYYSISWDAIISIHWNKSPAKREKNRIDNRSGRPRVKRVLRTFPGSLRSRSHKLQINSNIWLCTAPPTRPFFCLDILENHKKSSITLVRSHGIIQPPRESETPAPGSPTL